MNKVILSGNIGSIARNGNQAFMRVATKRLVRGEDEKFTPQTTWHDVIAHGKQADNVEKALKVGDVVQIDAYLSYGTAGSGDKVQNKTYVNVVTFELLSRKKAVSE